MAIVNYHTTPARMNDAFEPGATNYSLSSTKVTLSYGNLKVVITGSGFSQNLTGTIKGIDFYLNGKIQIDIDGLSISLKNAYYADDLYAYAMDKSVNGADKITGSVFADTLYGMGGNDRLTGGPGKDTLYGGSGKDIFDFNKPTESGPYSGSRDVIADFVRGQDKVDLSGIDANTKISGNNAFTKMIGAAANFSAAGQLKFANGILYGNIDADKAPEFSVQLTGVSKLALSDIVL